MCGETRNKCLILLAVLAICFRSANSINCYQCVGTNSTLPFQCNEFLSSDIDIEPESCDAVYGAQYCIKHIGRFEDCYQCASAKEWECMDGNLVEDALQPQNCDHVFEARYCVKTTGRYGGGIGAKRFCSSLDLGNYCNYVHQPGDKLSYRTCVYTCSGDGCNPASSVLPSVTGTVIPALIVGYRIVSHR